MPQGGGAFEIRIHANDAGVIIRDCTFIGNRTGTGQLGGGAISLNHADDQGSSGRSTVERCRFLGNESIGSGIQGGGGAIRIHNGAALIRNCVFGGNCSQELGGAVSIYRNNTDGVVLQPTILTNCVFFRNDTEAFDGGGAVANLGTQDTVAQVNVDNSVLWMNDGQNGPADQVYSDSSNASLTQVRSCAVQSAIAIHENVSGIGNFFELTPDWIDAAGRDGVVGTLDDDYHLTYADPGETLVEIGNDSYVDPDMVVDLDGSPRFVDGDGDGVTTVDIGPYEFLPGCPFCPGARTWREGVDGDFHDIARWDIGVPSEINEAVFLHPEQYTVSFSEIQAESLSINVTAGDVAFELGGAVYETSSVIEPALLITSLDDEARLTVAGPGSLIGPAGDLVVAGAFGAEGELIVSGTPEDAPLLVFDDLLAGAPGNGTVQILDGGIVANLRATIGGDVTGASGDVIVSGPASQWDVAFYAEVFNGTVTVTDGGVAGGVKARYSGGQKCAPGSVLTAGRGPSRPAGGRVGATE